MIYTKEDFIRVYKEIKSKGWIRTHRKGSTGIGKTLEDLLGIHENNLASPDFGEYELKSGRKNSQSMLTIFTKSPQPARANSYLREKFGYSSNAYNNTDKVLHATLSAVAFTRIADTGNELKIACDDKRIFIVSNITIEDVYWDREELRKFFERKYKNKFIYAKAESRYSGEKEEFYFCEAYEVSGFDYNAMIRLLQEGKIFIDLRIGQYPDGRTHDHGTGFRIRESDQPLLFKECQNLLE